MPTIDVDAREFSEALGELIRVVQFRDRDRACCHDLSVSQCYALEYVVEAGALTVNELAGHLYLDKSTASRVANSLVAKGLLARARDSADGRVVRLEPTAAGLDVQALVQTDLVNEYAALLADFDPHVRAAFPKLLGRLGRAFASRVDISNRRCCAVPASTGAAP
jgi:DNA-binding MarR family transcriptional regulator